MDEEYEDEVEEQEGQEEQEDEEEQLQQAQKMQQKMEEKILKNKLRATMARLAGGATMLNMEEKNTMKKAKKHEGLKTDRNLVNTMLIANNLKLKMKAMSASPILPYIGYGALILLAIIFIIVIIGYLMPWLFPGETEGGVGSQFGIKGNDFYGARMVYKDEELAKINMIEDYVELVQMGIDEANEVATPNVKLTINIVMPDEEFSYEEFDETAFSGSYPVLYSTITEIAKVIYKADTGSSASGTLLEITGGIPYFGIVQVDENSDGKDDITALIEEAIINNSTFESSGSGSGESGEGEGESEVDASDIENAKTAISEALSPLFTAEKYTIRTEKLFVKDYILSGEDMMKDIAKQNYIAFIFMPRKSVTFNKFSFSIGGADLTEFTISLKNNGSEITLKKDDADYSTDESGETQSYIYTTGDTLSVSAGVFEDIDENNLEALSEGLSLFDIVESVDNYSTYLETGTGESSISYYTIKKNGVVVELSNAEAFNFVEFETLWQAAS